MEVDEVTDVCQDRSMWQPIVSAYPYGKYYVYYA